VSKPGSLSVSTDYVLDGAPLRVSWGSGDVDCGPGGGPSQHDFVALYSPPSMPHAAWVDFMPPLGTCRL